MMDAETESSSLQIVEAVKEKSPKPNKKEKSPKPNKMVNGESEKHDNFVDCINNTESQDIDHSEPPKVNSEKPSQRRKSASKSPEPVKAKKEPTPLLERPRRSSTRSPQRVVAQIKEPTPQKTTISPPKKPTPPRVTSPNTDSTVLSKSQDQPKEAGPSREVRQSFRSDWMKGGRIRGRRPIRDYGTSSMETRKRKSGEQIGPDSGKKPMVDDSVNSPGWKYIPTPLQKLWSPQVAPTSSSTPLKLDQDSNLSMEVNYDEATIQKQWQDSWQQDSVKQTPSKGYHFAKPNWKCVVM